MGAGKSTVGGLLADRMSLPLIDLDAQIVLREGRSVSALFASGEARFRRAEAEALAAALAGPPAVLACGGGAPMAPGAVERMQRWGVTIFMEAPLQVLAARVGAGEGRPLWGEDIERRYASRLPTYRRAQLTVDAAGPPEGVADRIYALLQAPRTRREISDA